MFSRAGVVMLALCLTLPDPRAHSQGISFSRQIISNSFSSFGCAVGDYDGDGWDDIFVAGWYSTALFRNNRDGTFTDLAQQAGVKVNGRNYVGLWADVNNDGWPDLFVGVKDSIGTSRLFLNKGDGTFSDVTATSGINRHISVGSAAFGDFNNDGLVDLFIATGDAAPDLLYQNTSSGSSISFRDVSDSARIGGHRSTIPMQATWIDYNHDGFLDLFCVHDGFSYNRLYRNPGSFPFQEVAQAANLHWYGAANSMGVAWGDYDNDGWEDVYVTNIGRGGFYRNNGNGTFTDITSTSGADSNGMGWGVVWSDFDNDGDQDIFVVNLYQFNRSRSFLFENLGGTFRNIAALAGAALTVDGYGAATGDFNNDGYEDLFVTNHSNPPGQNVLLWNAKATTGHWVKVKLRGVTVNRMAIGATVRVAAGGKNHVRTVTAGSSYCSQVSATLHVGLGGADIIDTLEVQWKGDYSQRFTNLAADTTYLITEGSPITGVSDRTTYLNFSKSELLGNFPNPFNPSTTISFQVEGIHTGAERTSRTVSLKILDVLGQEVATVMEGHLMPGIYKRTWNSGGVPSGVYYAVLSVQAGPAGSVQRDVRPLLLLR